MASKWRKRLKNLGKNVSKVLKVAAPVAAFAVGGPLGLAVGAGLGVGGAALSGGNRRTKLKSLKRSGIAVAGGFGASAALGAISGQGLMAPGFSSLFKIGTSIFGGGSPTPPPQQQEGDLLSQAHFANEGVGGANFMQGAPGGGLLGSLFSGSGTSQTANPVDQGERGGGAFGGLFGGGEAGVGGAEKPGINMIWIIGGAAALLLLSGKKKAA